MSRISRLVPFSGAVLVALSGYFLAERSGPQLVSGIEQKAAAAIKAAGGRGVSAEFSNRFGWATRHPMLVGGEDLNEQIRADVARAVAQVPGVGGVYWQGSSARARSDAPQYEPLHCQEDVEGLLRTRSIRFEEASSALLPASEILLDEVATALRPCLGAIIAILGHTDSSGTKLGNLDLSRERARAVREALITRGIPRDGLRARGLGSQNPVEGLTPEDPANRRIEFSVISTEPLKPTPIDTPGAR
ncbi:OmpA family protein [Qipengyuania marisflavi]|uniref:OmpA family protein n=1 Tax=Qipengyuania marisflavi TaxID=2486356 RepID=A0A5S3PFQ8_9SPHN|nr:OmpA family protein [Qipengyuania marisflavi]TMM50420.1 OmpA family protein [Qipengyuania marisflavi]